MIFFKISRDTKNRAEKRDCPRKNWMSGHPTQNLKYFWQPEYVSGVGMARHHNFGFGTIPEGNTSVSILNRYHR